MLLSGTGFSGTNTPGRNMPAKLYTFTGHTYTEQNLYALRHTDGASSNITSSYFKDDLLFVGFGDEWSTHSGQFVMGQIAVYTIVGTTAYPSSVMTKPAFDQSSSGFGHHMVLLGNTLFVTDKDLNRPIGGKDHGIVYKFNRTTCTPKMKSIDTVGCDEPMTSPSGAYVWEKEGLYKDTIIPFDGCPEYLEVNVRFGKTTFVYGDSTFCGNIMLPSGKFVSNTGLIFDTITNASGCDSIYRLFAISLNPDATVYPMGDGGLEVKADSQEYQWYRCSRDTLLIDGETNRRYYPDSTGFYAAEVTNKATGCTIFSSCIYIDVDPIPVGDLFYFNYPLNGREIDVWVSSQINSPKIRVYSPQGKLVIDEDLEQGNNSVSVMGVSPGMYIVYLRWNGLEVRTYKIIVI